MIIATARVTPIDEMRPYFHPARNKGLKMCKPGRKKMRKISRIGTRIIKIGKNISMDHKTALFGFSCNGSESVINL